MAHLGSWFENYKENSVLFGFFYRHQNPHYRSSLLQRSVYAPIPHPIVRSLVKPITFIPFAFLNDLIIAPIVSPLYSTLNITPSYITWLTHEISVTTDPNPSFDQRVRAETDTLLAGAHQNQHPYIESWSKKTAAKNINHADPCRINR